ncbi:hypothetical protein OKW29_004197 [Paraburkholderia sp. CI3]
MDRMKTRAGRRCALRTLAALAAGAAAPLSTLRPALALVPDPAPANARARMMTDLIGTNGWAGSAADIEMWRAMGISWGRDTVGPGQPDRPGEAMRIDKTSSAFDIDLPPALLRNERNGIGSLLMLGYTPRWNATVPGDSNSAPVDVDAWKQYVDAVVRKYSAPPYNLRYFQVWNEAAGKLSGGLPKSVFWHGPEFSKDEKRSKPYERAMQDYVERIHIPAARIIRSYRAYVVYGGWPDQGGLDNFHRWLEYRSPVLKERMLDWVDYIDTHYLPVADMESLYQRYVQNGPARGIWQTEIGNEYMKDPHYLPRYFFDFAVWALGRNWDDPNKYLSMIYHWDGYEPFRLTHPGPPERTYNVSGRSLVVLHHRVASNSGWASGEFFEAAAMRSGCCCKCLAFRQRPRDAGEQQRGLAEHFHRRAAAAALARGAGRFHRCAERRGERTGQGCIELGQRFDERAIQGTRPGERRW